MRVRGAWALLLLLLAVSWGRAAEAEAEAEDAALSLTEGDEDAAPDAVFDSAPKLGQEEDDAALFEDDAAAAADVDADTPLESMVIYTLEKSAKYMSTSRNPFRAARSGGGRGARRGADVEVDAGVRRRVASWRADVAVADVVVADVADEEMEEDAAAKMSRINPWGISSAGEPEDPRNQETMMTSCSSLS
ncbi:Protein of unknown function [Gryllus bimaculatus]|nr:Protein of unknown function [Gryllus bimaculatus]